jgi:hypothetical protein
MCCVGRRLGDKLDMQKAEALKAGSFFVQPARHARYEWTENEETILHIQGIGPVGIDYINPADDSPSPSRPT